MVKGDEETDRVEAIQWTRTDGGQGAGGVAAGVAAAGGEGARR